jgi:tetratricopeptide (TPR) repeat protein
MRRSALKSSSLLRAAILGVAMFSYPAVAAGQSYWVMPRDSQYAQAMQRVGVTDITITYHRPLAKGRVLWGCESTDVLPKAGATYPCVVPYGQVWRAGANDATNITFSTAVVIDGHALPAGTYGLFMIPGPTEWTVIFNRNARQWGAFTYDQKQDALRIAVTPESGDLQDALLYNFSDVASDHARAELRWEKVRVAFDIAVDVVAQTKARGAMQFNQTDGWWAAGYWLNEQHNPEEALKWINASLAFGEDSNNLMMKANIVATLKRYDEAIALANRALVVVGQNSNQAFVAQLTAAIQKQIADWKQGKGLPG